MIATLGQLRHQADHRQSDRDHHACAGTPQVHGSAAAAVFVLPLLHPAAALRTPTLVETLREDFATLRELLDEPLPASRVAGATREPARAG